MWRLWCWGEHDGGLTKMQALISESRGTLGLQACQRNDAPDSEGHGSTATEPASQRIPGLDGGDGVRKGLTNGQQSSHRD